MRVLQRAATGIIAAALATATPVHAAADNSAEQLRRLDIMLMVTGLRCRTTADNFQADFQAFESQHLAELNAAARSLRASYVARFGARGADRELDRISTTMANQYGGGHPWLGCHELKQVTRSLALAQGAEPLIAAADELLHGDGPRLAYGGG